MVIHEVSRIEAFSDGVFAIAITLLILEFKVPILDVKNVTNQGLMQALFDLWPSMFAFTISFMAVLVMWINHHGLFNLIEKIDTALLLANGLILFLITFVPFPTAILASYFNTPASNFAAVQYCGMYVFLSSAFNLLWSIISNPKRGLIKKGIKKAHFKKISIAFRLAIPIYLIATVVAFFHPIIGLIINSLLWILWVRLDFTQR